MSHTDNGSGSGLMVNLNDNSAGRDFPEGAHVAVVDAIEDIYMQPGFEPKDAPRRKFVFRMHIAQRIESGALKGEFYTIPKIVTLSGYEKSLMAQIISALSPKRKDGSPVDTSQFDLGGLIGRSCLITVKNKVRAGKNRAEIEQFTALPSGMQELAREPKLATTPEWVERLREKRVDKPDAYTPSDIREIDDVGAQAAEGASSSSEECFDDDAGTVNF